MRYLCARHAQWLRDHPENIEAVWASGIETAEAFIADGDWSRALPHVGCACEAIQLACSDPQYQSAVWQRRESFSLALYKMVTGRLGLPSVTVH